MDKHLQDTLVQQGIKARNASRFLATASTSVKNQAINAIADALEANYQAIIKENQLDIPIQNFILV
jgi:glutamate-5-semialdehyde dehydrogenase